MLRLTGTISAIDGALFLKEVNRRQPRVIELSGPGGDLLNAARIGVIIHERGIATHATGSCRSACAFIWIAGSRMLADEGVEILNHLPEATEGVHDGQPHPMATRSSAGTSEG